MCRYALCRGVVSTCTWREEERRTTDLLEIDVIPAFPDIVRLVYPCGKHDGYVPLHSTLKLSISLVYKDGEILFRTHVVFLTSMFRGDEMRHFVCKSRHMSRSQRLCLLIQLVLEPTVHQLDCHRTTPNPTLSDTPLKQSTAPLNGLGVISIASSP